MKILTINSPIRTAAFLAVPLLAVIIASTALSAQVNSDEPLTGAEIGLQQIQSEIAYLREKGILDSDPVLQTLVADEARLVQLSAMPPPPPPDPAEVDRLLNLPPSAPDWDQGEVPCEGLDESAVNTLGIDLQGLFLRCAVVPRADGSALTVFLTGDGWAIATRTAWASIGGTVQYARVEIPTIEDFASSQIELVGEELHVVGKGGVLTIPTNGWLT